MPLLSVVIPTFNERANIIPLLDKLDHVLTGVDWEVVFVDDDSPDGTADHIRSLAQTNGRVRCVQRIGRRGLSSAVVEGLLSTSAPYIAVMDADLQHDEGILPVMLDKIRNENLDVVTGSRFAGNADVTEGLSKKRQTLSKVANSISRLLVRTDLADPMTGFFMIRREVIEDTAPHLSTAGFKILLDILASSPVALRVAEVPFNFRQRIHGQSKLDSFVLWEYLMLLIDKTVGRYIPSRFVLFALVGTTGLLSHFIALAAMRAGLGVSFGISEVVASLVAMTSNFFLNNMLTYRDRRLKGWQAVWGLLSFSAVCSIGAVTGVGVAQVLFDRNEGWMLAGGASALIGVVWNFAVSSTITWSRKPKPRIRPGAPVRESRLVALLKSRRELILYFFIGASASAMDVIIFYVLHNFAGFNSVAATAVSISCATVYAFALNAVLNFKTQDNIVRRFIAYSAVSAVGLMLSAMILYLFSEKLGFNGNIVKIATLPLIFVVQYKLNRKFSFQKLSEGAADMTAVYPVPSIPTTNPKKIAVIGGGFTGLVAAYRLTQMGHRVTVLEREDVVGGLAAGFELEGIPCEKAYHFLYRTDEHIIGLAKELGIADRLTFHKSSVSFFCEGKLYPFGGALDLIRFDQMPFIDRIRAGVVVLYLQILKKWEPLQNVTAYAWLKKWAGEKVTEIIWEPLLRGKFNRFYDKITMSWLWKRVAIRANSRDPKLGETLGYFSGGFRQITERLSQYIETHGGKIETGTPTLALKREADGRILLTTPKGETHYDRVISTIASPAFANILENSSDISRGYLERLRAVDYLGAAVMAFTTDREISPYYWHNIKDDRVPFLVLLGLTALVGKESVNGKYIYYIGAYVPHDHRYFSQSEDEIAAEWYAGLKVMFPHFSPEQVREMHLFRFKNAQHIVDIGYVDKKLVPFETPMAGLYLANFSQIYPDDRGTNFAVRDGNAIAARVNSDLTESSTATGTPAPVKIPLVTAQ